jgi:hypothetical protein
LAQLLTTTQPLPSPPATRSFVALAHPRSSLILLAHFNFPGFTYIDVAPYLTFRPSVALVLSLIFQIWYIILNEVVGATYLPVMGTMYLTATYLVNHVPEWLPWRYAFGPEPSALPFGLAVFFNGWFWQFVGHFAYEGRAPALFDNLTQGKLIARVLADTSPCHRAVLRPDRGALLPLQLAPVAAQAHPQPREPAHRGHEQSQAREGQEGDLAVVPDLDEADVECACTVESSFRVSSGRVLMLVVVDMLFY